MFGQYYEIFYCCFFLHSMKCLARIMKGLMLFFTGWNVEPEGEDGARDQGESHPAENHLKPGQGKLQASGRRCLADEPILDRNWRIDRKLEMMSDVPTNVGEHGTSIISCVRWQWHTKDAVFWYAQKALCIITLCIDLPFVGPNVISNTLTDRLFIFQFRNYVISSNASPLMR